MLVKNKTKLNYTYLIIGATSTKVFEYNCQFDTFFAKLDEILNKVRYGKNSKKLLKKMTNLSRLLTGDCFSNSPIVKLPNSNFYRYLNTTGYGKIIRSTEPTNSKQNNQQIPIYLDDRIALLYKSTLLNPITITTNNTLFVVSMINGKACHYIKEINTPNIEFKDLLKKMFLTSYETNNIEKRKLYLIETAKCKSKTFHSITILISSNQDAIVRFIYKKEFFKLYLNNTSSELTSDLLTKDKERNLKLEELIINSVRTDEFALYQASMGNETSAHFDKIITVWMEFLLQQMWSMVELDKWAQSPGIPAGSVNI